MNDFKASKQNFDSSYIYKVEEREESEKIFCHSDRGLVSIETNELPKVTRYFLKNNKGEPQGYIERKLVQNFNPDRTGEEDEFNPQNVTSDKVMPVPYVGNSKMKTASHTTVESGKKLSRFDKKSIRFRPSHELSSPLNSSAFERRKNHVLDCASSNSERTFNIKQPASTADSSIERNIKRRPAKGKSFVKLTAKRSHGLFCNDPNKRLKNLFTIIKPTEKVNENANVNVANGYDADLLNKTKNFLVKLIDDELQRTHLSDEDAAKDVKLHCGNMIDRRTLKKLKLDCIAKIEEELRLMKRLQI
ncbi:uncharacterized protein LOC119085844 [Bradysia coprophila]|uniref:uncharacterized protein LOC119085844 n=1 Tax=Bradysia coprophila TaxID=38358 RepID=UPI00187D7828|nr:uncharacterized protein LOC119085844 [Bradysia coprophila]